MPPSRLAPWALLLALALALAPRAAHAQQALSLEDVARLLEARVAPARVEQLARESCLDFAVDAAAARRLREAGATDALVRALGDASICRAAPVPPGARGAAAPPPAAEDARPAKAPPVRGRGFFLSLGYSHARVEPDGADALGGPGFALEAGYGITPSLALFARGDFATLGEDAPDAAGEVGHTDLGARLYLGGAAWPVRPYADAALSLVAVRPEGSDGDGETYAFAPSVGGGVQAFLGTPRAALNGGVRVVPRATLEPLAPDDEARTVRAELRLDWYP